VSFFSQIGEADAAHPGHLARLGGRRMAVAAAAFAAAALALGACSSPPPTTFDLSAPRDVGKSAGGQGQLAVGEPIAVQALDSERIIVKDQADAISFLPGVQWADRLPRLVQTRLIQTFENASRIASVGRPGGGLVADSLLVTEIRAFQIEAAGSQALVEITAKLVTSAGRVVAARLFTARVPVASLEGPNAAQALDKALSQVMRDIVRWTSGRRA
jgi:cholesterol transport system auxiliary component